jgi:hypothetical protein
MLAARDLEKFSYTLPYASELFGVYSPMIGWRSRRIIRRIRRGFAADIANLKYQVLANVAPRVELEAVVRDSAAVAGPLQIRHIEPAAAPRAPALTGSFLLEDVGRALPPEDELTDDVWDRLLTRQALTDRLNGRVSDVISSTYYNLEFRRLHADQADTLLVKQVEDESRFAGMILEMRNNKDYGSLQTLFYGKTTLYDRLRESLKYQDPLEVFDPRGDLGRVSLSPIGIVHLFRQYFFEFDTFLGTPVEHVWLSPGSQVELIETRTRKTVIEKSLELESFFSSKTETALTESNELSEAVTSENRSNVAFGVNAQVEQGWVGGSAQASTSMNLDKSQSQGRQNTHNRMRQQSSRLATEIRRNVKSTFKTVTEATDFSSKRYLLQNTTDKLINYELRRKMRQVGVQVQDVGTYLCWQTYVDDPGRQLGVAELVHLAKSPELGNIPPPEAVPVPEKVVADLPISIPFEPKTGDTTPDDMDETYKNGKEVDEDLNEGDPERVRWKFGPFTQASPQTGFVAEAIDFDYQNNDIRCEAVGIDQSKPGTVQFGIKVRHVNFRNVSPLQIIAKVTWRPTQDSLDAIGAQNEQNLSKYKAQEQLAFKRAFVEAARERIELASEVKRRPYDELREEERIVVYRALIQEMLTRDIPMTDDRTRHVVSELINTVFDIDKMLYFVAAEWWRPRLHRSHQHLGEETTPAAATTSGTSASVFGGGLYKIAKGLSKVMAPVGTAIEQEHIVTWGGDTGNRFDNYYITENSAPAPLGASLGWLLQLDGDDMRNAFLNAPWVKAVIPIRPGMERAAMNWLSRQHVEGTEGLDSDYLAPPEELAEIPHQGPRPTLRDAILHLCDTVAAKQQAGTQTGRYPLEEINDDNRVTATPVDKVYEHGFYPIQGGFKLNVTGPFEVFDQWVEILPTDQIAPVEVAYDPITGRQVT